MTDWTEHIYEDTESIPTEKSSGSLLLQCLPFMTCRGKSTSHLYLLMTFSGFFYNLMLNSVMCLCRPGFVRINLPYFMDEETVQFVLEAVKNVAKDGWKLLPQVRFLSCSKGYISCNIKVYMNERNCTVKCVVMHHECFFQYMFNPETGEWRQKDFQVFKDRKWLGHISYKSGEMSYKLPPPIVKGPLPADYAVSNFPLLYHPMCRCTRFKFLHKYRLTTEVEKVETVV